MNEKIKDAANITTDELQQARLIQSELLLQILEYCSIRPGASITIQVTHDDGQIITAGLYDDAALVQGLYAAITDFQENIA